VATWNVEHFVDAYDDPYIDNEREDEAAPAAVEARVAQLASVLRALDADVVVLQEFESAAFAEALADSVFPDLGYRYFAATESRSWYMNVVLMSRLPVGTVRSYASVETPVVGQTDSTGAPVTQRLTNNRMWLADVVARPDYVFTLAGLHLKAGRGERNAGWRIGQVRLLRREMNRLRREDPDANILVAGDLNMLPDSPEMALLLGTAPGAEGPLRLTDPLSPTGDFTHPADDPARRLDYLLPNVYMRPELVPGSVQIFSPLPPDAQREASDHLPVRATFLTRDREVEAPPFSP
jgi:endonuclease/exonuclease/phosphatase family metal-dependent hydrolase